MPTTCYVFAAALGSAMRRYNWYFRLSLIWMAVLVLGCAYLLFNQ